MAKRGFPKVHRRRAEIREQLRRKAVEALKDPPPGRAPMSGQTDLIHWMAEPNLGWTFGSGGTP